MYNAQNTANEAYLKESTAFLEENKKKEGVVTLPSGLQYEVPTEGTGATPDSTSTVKLHYEGSTIDGTVFDSSIQRGEPVEFTLGPGLIAGFNEAVTRMPVGSKWKIYMPSSLAYGANPPGGSGIKPNSALVFVVELLEIVNE